MTTPTDDELLAEAKTVVAGRSDGETAKYRDDQLNGWFVFAVKIARGYIALHERHRAEVERLTRENNNMSAGQKHALESCWAAEAALAAAKVMLAGHQKLIESRDAELAAERKRCGDALAIIDGAHRQRCSGYLRCCDHFYHAGDIDRVRDTLAGKDARVTQHQRPEKSTE